MKILVTGGAGFIGSNYVHHALRTRPNDHIIVLDKLTYAGNVENLKSVSNNPRYSFIQGDICDVRLMQEIIGRIDTVVHFAAETHVDRSVQDPAAFVRTNIVGTQTLLDACRARGSVRFHHVSTDEVFGSLGARGLFSETTKYDPHSPYSASKAASDHLVRAAWHTYKLPITVSHCTNNFGPYCFPEKFIPLAIVNILEGKKVPLYGDGMNIRDWLYVEDHCRGIDAVLQKGRVGESYCFAGRAERTNAEVLQCLLFELGASRDMIQMVTDRPGHDRRYAMDCQKAERELGWSPETPFLHGLRQTIEWYKTNRSWWENIRSSAYQQYYEKQYGVNGVTRPVEGDILNV